MADALVEIAKQLAEAVAPLHFSAPVAYVYHPLDYAWTGHQAYLQRFGGGRKRVLFLGMNPGPWGMAQTGVPFGEVHHVRDWMGLQAAIGTPRREHPKRPVQGLNCTRSEVSGRRLWGLFAERFETPARFFREHLVVNYCPLLFLAESGRNITPDKLPAEEAAPLLEACNAHLRRVVAASRPDWLIGVGAFAEARLRDVVPDHPQVLRILHPSPASPAANRDWPGATTRRLQEYRVWS